MTHRKPPIFLILFTLLGLAPLQAWGEVEAKVTDEGGHIFRIILGADPVVKLVLVILLAMSVVSWAIIVYKYRYLKQWRQASRRFLDLFWKSRSLDDLITKASLPSNPVQNIFKKGVADLVRKRRKANLGDAPDLEVIQRTVERATDDELERAERYIPFLATTGTSAPYIGLFGTVWGILAAFWEIGKAGTSSLAVVGPYIAEALIATALGLATAIPAVIFYNFFVTRIRTFSRTVTLFREDLLARVAKDYFE